MANTFSYNIKYLRKLRGLSTKDVADRLKVGPSTIGNYEAGWSFPSHDKILELAELFEVSTDILLKGDLMNNDLEVLKLKETEDNSVNEPEVIPLHTDKIPGKILPETSIPVFNDGGSAGHAELYQDFKERPAAFIRVPGYEDCDFATYAYGHSMYPIIESGALILCRKTINKQMILWGEIYYIITSDHRLIKRLQKGSSKESVMAISENEEKRKDGHTKFEPIEIQVDDIKDLYIVKGIIKKIQI